MGDIHYSKHITKSNRLRNILCNTNYRIWCFTSGLEKRARAILKALEIEDMIEGVICVDGNSMDAIVKPKPESFLFVESLLGITSYDTVYFFDDLKPNINAAMSRGWKAFHVEHLDHMMSLLEPLLN